jgi:hypothetical protein
MRDLKLDNPELNFIMNNVFDDPFIVEEDIYHLVKEDITLKLNLIEQFADINSIIITILAFFLNISILIQEFVFLRQRRRFVEVIRKIPIIDIEKEVNPIKNFVNALQNNKSLETDFGN